MIGKVIGIVVEQYPYSGASLILILVFAQAPDKGREEKDRDGKADKDEQNDDAHSIFL
jgi:hypothetical protein